MLLKGLMRWRIDNENMIFILYTMTNGSVPLHPQVVSPKALAELITTSSIGNIQAANSSFLPFEYDMIQHISLPIHLAEDSLI